MCNLLERGRKMLNNYILYVIDRCKNKNVSSVLMGKIGKDGLCNKRNVENYV